MITQGRGFKLRKRGLILLTLVEQGEVIVRGRPFRINFNRPPKRALGASGIELALIYKSERVFDRSEFRSLKRRKCSLGFVIEL